MNCTICNKSIFYKKEQFACHRTGNEIYLRKESADTIFTTATEKVSSNTYQSLFDAMNILLAYSAKHFNPEKENSAERNFSASSAATLARTLYHILREMGHVEYVDGLKPPKKLARKHYDLMVGIQGSITPLSKLATFDKVVLFAVNMHPRTRNRILQDFNQRYKVCSQKHIDRNTVHFRQLDDIQRADAVFLVGNATVARSFLQNGKALSSIRRFNYASALPLRAADTLSPDSVPRILYVSTEMCLRKGFDILSNMLTKFQDTPYMCGIIGGSGDADYQYKLSNLQKQLGDKIHLHGWVDSSSPEYRNLLQQYDFVLFPSLEEGQAGSVLDAMSQGLIPLITRETGIDFAPLGYFLPALDSEHNEDILKRALSLAKGQILPLQKQTLQYYQRYHLYWQNNLKRAFHYLLHTGSPWPDVSSDNSTAYHLIKGHACPSSLVYDVLDQLELVSAGSATAVIDCQKQQRMSWKESALHPTHFTLQILHKPAKEALHLLGEANADGEDLLSAPLQAQQHPANAWRKMITSCYTRILSLLHPSKRRRKNYYNLYRNTQDNIS